MNEAVCDRVGHAYEEWMSAIDSFEDAIFMHDKDFRILRCNKAYQQYAGVPFKEIIGQKYFEVFPKMEAPLHSCREAIETLTGRGHEEELQIEGRIFRSRSYCITDEHGEHLYSMHTLEDITDFKQTEQKIRDTKMFSETLIQSLPGIFFLVDQNAGMVKWNKRLEELTGLSSEEIRGVNAITFMHEDDKEYAMQNLQKAFEAGYASVEVRMPLTNGIRYYRITGHRIETQYGVNVIGIGMDITEQREAQELVRKSEEKFRALVESTNDWIWEIDSNGIYTYVSPQVEKLLGYKPEEMVGKSPFELMPKSEIKRLGPLFQELVEKRAPLVTMENINVHKDGRIVVLETSGTPFFDEKGTFAGYRGIDRDITDRKQSEASLKRLNRALRTLSAGNLALVRAASEDELIREVTHIIVEKGEYSLAVVDYAEDNETKRIVPMAWAGLQKRHFWIRNLSWDDVEEGQLPVARTIRTGKTHISHDIAADPAFTPWKEGALAQGYVSNIALPLCEGNKTFGALCIYSSEAKSYDEEEVKLLEELANDLAYGIVNLRARAAHEQQASLLRESLEESIQAIAATLESRDPYTAGHQRRVSELATAIAREMNLSEEQIKGVEFAGVIHDLGKIHVPAEILSKPGRLNELEYKLIQMHPQTGYDILKNIKFPWPIADIILQHHEKIDGSGYPQGLRGNEILLESKIISVADVVEAISSHRPYRPALGMEVAIEEIKRGSGTAYDAAVVDACIRVFNEKGFAFNFDKF